MCCEQPRCFFCVAVQLVEGDPLICAGARVGQGMCLRPFVDWSVLSAVERSVVLVPRTTSSRKKWMCAAAKRCTFGSFFCVANMSATH